MRLLTTASAAATVTGRLSHANDNGGTTMRRSAILLTLPAVIALLPAQSASAACVSSSGVTACPTIYNCFPNGTVSVTVVGVGSGTASCGGGVASCFSPRVNCDASDTVQSTGTLSCSSTGTAVAICTVTIAAT